VGPDALIPRPETELLAEQAWGWLAGRSALAGGDAARTVLDFGTGTGCLAIAIVKHDPAARVVAVDISPEALELARRNALANGVADRIEFQLSDAFTAVPSGRQFDLIVANPPYIASSEVARLEPEVRDHDPRLALDGGSDGLDFYRRLAAEGRAFLRPEGRLMAEFGDDQSQEIRGLFEAAGWRVIEILPDLSGRLRLIVVGVG
jgi:release factor glutamine methyltransferase